MIRLQREIMNPKKADMETLVTAIMEWSREAETDGD